MEQVFPTALGPAAINGVGEPPSNMRSNLLISGV